MPKHGEYEKKALSVRSKYEIVWRSAVSGCSEDDNSKMEFSEDIAPMTGGNGALLNRMKLRQKPGR